MANPSNDEDLKIKSSNEMSFISWEEIHEYPFYATGIPDENQQPVDQIISHSN